MRAGSDNQTIPARASLLFLFFISLLYPKPQIQLSLSSPAPGFSQVTPSPPTQPIFQKWEGVDD